MPEVYSDDNGARVIVRHRGPAGKGVPAGGTTGQILAKTSDDDYDGEWVNPPDGVNAVAGPVSSVDGRVATFDGTTGKLIKDSGTLLSALATVSLVGTKQDAEPGKGLSTEDFTSALKTKLDGLIYHYRGSYADAAAVLSGVVDPVAGDYVLIEDAGSDLVFGLWDATNSVWRYFGNETLDGAAIAAVLFDDGEDWELVDCNIFTDAYRALIDQHQSYFDNGLADIVSGVLAYVEKTVDYTLTANDRVVNCTANSFTVTLPLATADNQGKAYTVKNSGTGAITIATSDGIQLIDSATTYVLSTQWESVNVQSTGSGWIII